MVSVVVLMSVSSLSVCVICLSVVLSDGVSGGVDECIIVVCVCDLSVSCTQ